MLTINQYASIHGISRQAVWKKVDDGELEAEKIHEVARKLRKSIPFLGKDHYNGWIEPILDFIQLIESGRNIWVVME